jgi:hypothetical protein
VSAPKTGYKFGNKNQWRRWVWCRIAERLRGRAKDALVVYLAGQEDLDRANAVRKGFRASNLIAVDKSASVVGALRTSGALAIDADLIAVIEAWNPSRQIDVVLADFCCGFERPVVRALIGALFSPHAFGAVIVVNFLRGRDPSSNALRAALSLGLDDERQKHRGAMFVMAQCGYIAGSAVAERRGISTDQIPDDDAESMTIMDALISNCRPALYSYKSSSGQVFDTVVFRNIGVSERARAGVIRKWREQRTAQSDIGVRRKVAAAMAHRTMFVDRHRGAE